MNYLSATELQKSLVLPATQNCSEKADLKAVGGVT
jgi:hypothetical protein